MPGLIVRVALPLLLLLHLHVPVGDARPIIEGPAPRIDAYPTLYRLDHGQWVRSLLFAPGDHVRFVMPFRTAAPGWIRPVGTLKLQRERVPFYKQPVVLQQPLASRPARDGFRVFSASFQIPRSGWHGHWILSPVMRSGGGEIVPETGFVVISRMPDILNVPRAIALCTAHPADRTNVWIGGVWGGVEALWLGKTSGWLAQRWPGREHMQRWWEHGRLWTVFTSRVIGDTPPSDGFLQMRARLDCPSHTLTALARPVSP